MHAIVLWFSYLCINNVLFCVCLREELGSFLDSLQVKYSAYRDRPVDERKRRFVEDLREGHSVIVSKSKSTRVVQALYKLYYIAQSMFSVHFISIYALRDYRLLVDIFSSLHIANIK